MRQGAAAAPLTCGACSIAVAVIIPLRSETSQTCCCSAIYHPPKRGCWFQTCTARRRAPGLATCRTVRSPRLLSSASRRLPIRRRNVIATTSLRPCVNDGRRHWNRQADCLFGERSSFRLLFHLHAVVLLSTHFFPFLFAVIFLFHFLFMNNSLSRT